MEKDNEKTSEKNGSSLIDAFVEYSIKIKSFFPVIWKNKYKIILFNSIVAVFTVAYLLIYMKPYYKSSVTILPSYGNRSGDLIAQYSGLAALSGVDIGKTDPTQIYQNLLVSESIMEPVIYSKYLTSKSEYPINLLEYFGLEENGSFPDSTSKRKAFLGIYSMLTKGAMVTELERGTKILTVSIEMPEPQLAADVVNNIVRSLDKYITSQRQNYASEQRKYIESRIISVKDTLEIAEGSLKTFRESNRSVIASPELQLLQGRLMRKVEIQSTIYAELLKQLELIKLEEVKNTPVLNIKEYAKPLVTKSGPQRMGLFIVTLMFSFISSIGYFISRSTLQKAIIKIKRS